jgi:hypothetical protein
MSGSTFFKDGIAPIDMPAKYQCHFIARGIFPVSSMTSNANVVAKISAKQVEKNVFDLNYDFDNGMLTKIWRISPELAKEYIHVDKKSLESNFPGVKRLKGDDYPFYNLSPPSEIASEGGRAKVDVQKYDGKAFHPAKAMAAEVIAVGQKGWAVDSWKKNGSCENRSGDVEACQMIRVLSLIQKRKSVQSRLVAKVERHGDGALLKLDSPGIPGLIAPSYSVSAAIEFPVDFWVRTEKEGDVSNAARKFEAMSKSTMTGGDGFKDIKEYSAWADNIFNNGKEGTISTIPIHVPKEFKPSDDLFVPTDFDGIEGTIRKNCVTTPLLVDGSGNFVPFATKKGRKTSAAVFGKRSAQEIRGWKWACSQTKGSKEGIVPVTVSILRGVDSVPTGSTSVSVDQSSISDAASDVAISSWNVVAKSEMEIGNQKINDVNDLVDKIIDRSKKVNGSDVNTGYIKRMLAGSKREPIILGESGIVEGPVLERRKAGGDDPQKLKGIIGKHRVVAVKSDLESLGSDCFKTG